MGYAKDHKEKMISTSNHKELKEKDLISVLADKDYQNSGIDVTLSLRPPGEQLKSCTVCGATSTPLWRNDPNGSKKVCNACGLKFRRAQQKIDTSLCLSPVMKQRN